MPRKWRGSGRGNWGARKQDPQKNITSTNRLGAGQGDTEQRLETKRGASREPHDQHGVLDMLNMTARDQKGKKENTGRLKEEATKK